jgi:hypothetical protein
MEYIYNVYNVYKRYKHKIHRKYTEGIYKSHRSVVQSIWEGKQGGHVGVVVRSVQGVIALSSGVSLYWAWGVGPVSGLLVSLSYVWLDNVFSGGPGCMCRSMCSPAKGVKKSETPHINKDSSPLSVLLLFFTEIFHLPIQQTNVYYQQHLHRQAGPSPNCLTLRCRTWQGSLS